MYKSKKTAVWLSYCYGAGRGIRHLLSHTTRSEQALRDFGGKQFPESFSFAETLPGSNPIQYIITKRQPKGCHFVMSSGYEKDGFAFFIDGFEPSEMMDRGFEGSKIPSNRDLSL